jgi:protein gp37
LAEAARMEQKGWEGRFEATVFCASLADVFDNKVPDDWRQHLWALIAETPHLDWLLLTKRPQNIAAMLPSSWGTGWPNVWLGTTAENQTEADRRLPVLTKIPAAVHFVSVEPMLGRMRLEPYLEDVDWVICAGESGAGARHMDPDDAADLLAQCQAAGTAFFMKQMTKKAPIPPSLFVREMPTGKADRPLETSAHA